MRGTREHHAERKPISVLVAEDAPVIRRALRRILEGFAEVSVVRDSSLRDMVSQARKVQPDVVVINVVNPTSKHVELAKSLRRLPKRPEIIAITHYKHPQLIRSFFEIGGGACLLMETANVTLLAAIRRVAAGRKYIDSAVSDEVVAAMIGDKAYPGVCLSGREREVLRFLALGYSYKETAQALEISVSSVETYRARIVQKLDLRGRAEMIRYALLHGILQPQDEAGAA